MDVRRLSICDRSCEIIKYINDILKGLEKPVYNVLGDLMYEGIKAPDCVVEKAKWLAIQIAERDIATRRTPRVLAAACVYLAFYMCGFPIVQRRIVYTTLNAGLKPVAEVSIRSAKEEIIRGLRDVLGDEL